MDIRKFLSKKPRLSQQSDGAHNVLEVETPSNVLPIEPSLESGRSNYDIGVCIGKRNTLSQEEIFNYLTKTHVPDVSFEFPASVEGSRNRKFQYSWLGRYKWLAYSIKKSGAFCKYCVLFAADHVEAGSHQALKTLVTLPMVKYKKGVEELNRHSSLQYHLFSEEKAKGFIQNYNSANLTAVDVLIDNKKQEIIKSNMKHLGPIVKTVIFCARNNMSLRGHRESGALVSETQKQKTLSGEEGIFRALLAFRMDAGDNDLQIHMNTAPRNCTLISKTIQNEIIDIIGNLIRSKIVDRVKKSKFYSIIADETTDISKKEQLVLCVRYLDVDNLMMREDFIGFIHVKSTAAKDLKKSITDELAILGLALEDLLGQGYDGGSNMAGKYNGVQALISKEQPLAFYTHCFNHCLNLCVCKSCEVPQVRNMLGIISSITAFFSNSPKRVLLLEEKIGDEAPQGSKNRLKTMCATRWVERHECVQTFCELLPYIYGVLEDLESNKDADTSTKGTQFSASLKRSDFLISLNINNVINSSTLTLSRVLQAPELQVSTAYAHVDNLLELFSTMRKDETSFNDIFHEAEKSALALDTELKIPRVCNRQKNRSNIEKETPLEYYRASIYYPYLDHMVNSLELRFKGDFLRILPLECLVPAYRTKRSIDEIVVSFNLKDA